LRWEDVREELLKVEKFARLVNRKFFISLFNNTTELTIFYHSRYTPGYNAHLYLNTTDILLRSQFIEIFFYTCV
jgi:hypothetical protein